AKLPSAAAHPACAGAHPPHAAAGPPAVAAELLRAAARAPRMLDLHTWCSSADTVCCSRAPSCSSAHTSYVGAVHLLQQRGHLVCWSCAPRAAARLHDVRSALLEADGSDRKSTRLNSSHRTTSYA